MPACAIRDCRNTDRLGYSLFTVTKFRRNVLNWLTLCSLPESTPTKAAICEGHFTPDDFEVIDSLGTVKLKRMACPSILHSNPSSTLQRQTFRLMERKEKHGQLDVTLEEVAVRNTKVLLSSNADSPERGGSGDTLVKRKSSYPCKEDVKKHRTKENRKRPLILHKHSKSDMKAPLQNVSNANLPTLSETSDAQPDKMSQGRNDVRSETLALKWQKDEIQHSNSCSGEHIFCDRIEARADQLEMGSYSNATPDIGTQLSASYSGEQISHNSIEPSDQGEIGSSNYATPSRGYEMESKYLIVTDRGAMLNIKNMQDNMKKLQAENDKLKLQVEEFVKAGFNASNNICTLFNEDQLKVLERETASDNTREWSPETIQKAISIRLVCRCRGYETLRLDHHWPLPSLNTINRRLKHLDFVPGSFQTMIKWLHHKLVHENNASGQFCVLSIDEMSLTARVEYDKGLKRYLGFVSAEIARNEAEKSKKANHCLAVMARGLTIHWKQLVTYLLTGDSVDPQRLWDYLKTLIVALGKLQISAVVVSSDMGGGNVGMWSHVGVKYTRHIVLSSSAHPAPSDQVTELFFSPDVPHLLKNLWAQLLRTSFILPDWYVKEKHLPSNIVSSAHVKEYLNAQGQVGARPVPGLTFAALEPTKFEKMRVPVAVTFFSEKHGHALILAAEKGIISPEAKATGLFIIDVAVWYRILAARSKFSSLGHGTDSEERIAILDKFMKLIHDITFWRVSSNKSDLVWKPVQGGIVLATTVVIKLWSNLVLKNVIEYLLPSRLFTSSCENLFSQARAGGDVHPRPVRLRQMLRLISTAQYLRSSTASRNSYEDDDEPYYINFLKIPSTRHEDWNYSEEEVDEILDMNPADLSYLTKQGLYYICGWVAFKLKDKCQSCGKVICVNEPLDFVPYEFTVAVSKGFLTHPSRVVWTIILHLEDIIQSNADSLLLKENVKNFLVCCVAKKCEFLKSQFPKCHDGVSLVANQFLALRLHIMASDASAELRNPILYSSASAFMRTAAANCRDAKKQVVDNLPLAVKNDKRSLSMGPSSSNASNTPTDAIAPWFSPQESKTESSTKTPKSSKTLLKRLLL